MNKIEQSPSFSGMPASQEKKQPDAQVPEQKALEDAPLPVGGYNEKIQAAPNIRKAKPSDAARLAAIYQEGYAGPPWNEEHDLEEMQHHFDHWIEDPDAQVLVLGKDPAASGENIRGFSVTRIEPSQTERKQHAAEESDLELQDPIEGLTQSIVEEMKAVSGVDLTQTQIAHLKENLQKLKPDQLGLDEGGPFAGIFQDIVILNSESRDFLNLIGAALGSLLRTRSDMLLIYTHEQVGSVVKTAEQLGGEQVLKLDNGLVVYAAPTAVVLENLSQNPLLQKFVNP